MLELLIVIAIVAILAGLLLPALNNAREKANAIASVSNMKQIQQALIGYVDDNRESFPCYGNPAPSLPPDINWIYRLYDGDYLKGGAVFLRFRNPRPLGVVRDHQGLPEGLPMLYYLNCPHSEKGYSMSRFIKIAHVLW